jgi:hypothetical protein
MTNGERLKVVLKPRLDEIKIYGDWVEIEIQRLGINFSCTLEWWNAEYKEPSSSEKLNKSETPTSSDDCISRQAVEDAMYDATRAMDLNYGQIMDYIDNMPPATPIRPKGHWIKTELPSRDAHECSECGNLAIFDECRNEEMLTDFCPHCGADMREVRE